VSTFLIKIQELSTLRHVPKPGSSLWLSIYTLVYSWCNFVILLKYTCIYLEAECRRRSFESAIIERTSSISWCETRILRARRRREWGEKRSVFACSIVVTLFVAKGYECDIAIKPFKLRNDSGTIGYGRLRLCTRQYRMLKLNVYGQIIFLPLKGETINQPGWNLVRISAQRANFGRDRRKKWAQKPLDSSKVGQISVVTYGYI